MGVGGCINSTCCKKKGKTIELYSIVESISEIRAGQTFSPTLKIPVDVGSLMDSDLRMNHSETTKSRIEYVIHIVDEKIKDSYKRKVNRNWDQRREETNIRSNLVFSITNLRDTYDYDMNIQDELTWCIYSLYDIILA